MLNETKRSPSGLDQTINISSMFGTFEQVIEKVLGCYDTGGRESVSLG